MENINLNNIKNKRVLIVGLGKSGIAATQAMLSLGAVVTVQDSKDIDKIEQLVTFLKNRHGNSSEPDAELWSLRYSCRSGRSDTIREAEAGLNIGNWR
ncbi:MAG: hypothetical protein ACLTK0_01080 [Anaerovoracaceae bacterium]